MHITKNTRKTCSKRYSLTLRSLYFEEIDLMVEEGLFMEPQEAVRAGLRLLFEKHNSIRYENILRRVREGEKISEKTFEPIP